MGVRGLTTFVNYKQDTFLKDYLLHDSCLVIDGHSLCAQLYRLMNCFSAFGGDYDKFASYTKNFFKNLRKCNINPYVIFDGSYESRKLKTAYSRLRSKINGASRLDPVTQGCLQIFPLLLRDAFLEALVEMNVPNTTCEFEADDEIAAMARFLDCPVLSYDSDFFIYNVQYIPFNTLDFKAKPMEADGKRIHVLECKIYIVEYLISHFGGMKEEMLPLLATLLGNDYVEKRVFNKFFSQLKMPKSKKKKNDQQRCIQGLFQWLQNETLDSAIAKILGRLRKSQKDKVFFLIKKSIEGYNNKHCRSLKYFDICHDIANTESKLHIKVNDVFNDSHTDENHEGNTDASNDDDDNESSDSDSENEFVSDTEVTLGVPEWFAEGIRKGYIAKPFINLFTHHLYFCSPQAEDYTAEDSFLCTLPILRYAFDILTDFSEEYCTYVSREGDHNYRRILVTDHIIPRPLDIPYQELTDDQLTLYFDQFLKTHMPKLDTADLDPLPLDFRLFMVSIFWWVSKCEVSIGNVHSLFISYIMLNVIDEKTGTFRGHFHFNNKFSKKIEELKQDSAKVEDTEDLFLNKNKVQYGDCLIAAGVLLKLFDLDDKIKKKPKSYDIRKIHFFAQFQCCLHMLNCLNSLCHLPFESTKYSKCYNGTFVYNMSAKLENQTDPKCFIEQYLKGATTVLMFYKSLCKIYEQFAETLSLTTHKWSSKVRRRRKRENKDLDEINFIVKGFESEVII